MLNDPPTPYPLGDAASAFESELLLREFSQRTREGIALILGVLYLARSSRPSGPAGTLLDEAIGRLRCFSDLHLILNTGPRITIDAGLDIETVCRSVAGVRSAARRGVMRLDLPSTRLPARVARRLALVAAELVDDGVRNALDGRRGRLTVKLRSNAAEVWLMVSDDRPAMRREVHAGERRDLVRELVRLANGVLHVRSGPRGRIVSVTLPLEPFPAPDDNLPF